MATKVADIDRYLDRIERATPVLVRGWVKEVIGLVVKAVVPDHRVKWCPQAIALR